MLLFDVIQFQPGDSSVCTGTRL